jgi:hypothetical protein
MASFLGCFVAGACLRGNRIDHSESAGEGTRTGEEGPGGRGKSRPVPQRELRALEPPSSPLYHEGANGFPGEHPLRVGLNGLDTISRLPQCERVRSMPPDSDPNSAVAHTGPQLEWSSPGPRSFRRENNSPELSKQRPDRSLERNRHGPSILNPPHFGKGGWVDAENRSKFVAILTSLGSG